MPTQTQTQAAEYDDELAFYETTLRAAEGDAGLVLSHLEVAPGCNVGDNFSSIVTRTTAQGTRGSGEAFQRSMIVKRTPQTDQFRCLAAFAKETDAYCGLVPTLRSLCERARLPLPLAGCLHASRTLRPDHIILEDLTTLGYSMRPRQQGMDLQHALLIMEALGRFHGASLALRRLDARTFLELRADTSELIFFPAAEAVFACSLRASTTMAALSLRQSGRADLAQRLQARAARTGVFQEMCAVVAPPADGDVVPGVFTHGDCWANNLLFKYGPGGAPCQTRLVDLAGIRYSSPALDLLHFLYTSVQRDVRLRHHDDLLQRYLRTLRATVRELVRANAADAPLDPSLRRGAADDEDDVFSEEQLKEEMRKRAAFGLWIGLWMLPAIFFSPDIVPSSDSDSPVDYFSEETQAHMCKALPREFHRRLLHLVEDHAEDGTL
ncbi:uncharacterized protein LOC117652260 isoform X2 [Thrips palmi]|uniref:Uncharacterized protein LOC117652260 isoform X2 n=1 Tax=Thrips palmi TaxID=161013 RepID=A0A6P9A5X0_THRPL|nr:uncharacterized protein LOC117652260 isoform X2 [Thrips palmi]